MLALWFGSNERIVSNGLGLPSPCFAALEGLVWFVVSENLLGLCQSGRLAQQTCAAVRSGPGPTSDYGRDQLLLLVR